MNNTYHAQADPNTMLIKKPYIQNTTYLHIENLEIITLFSFLFEFQYEILTIFKTVKILTLQKEKN